MKNDSARNKSPLVSVVIPTYRRSESLLRAIRSVLNQTYDNIELIVINDNQKDSKEYGDVTKIINSFSERIKYVCHEGNKGGAAARNTGIAASEGEYIAFLDDDDEFCSEKILLQVKRMSELDDSWGGCYCGYERIIDGNCFQRISQYDEGNILSNLLKLENSIAAGSTLLIKKVVVDDLGGFDESFIRHQDWEFMVRFFSKYKLSCVPRILVKLHIDDRRNSPSAATLENTKEEFFRKFQTTIMNLPPQDQKLIFKRHMLEVCKAFIAERSFKKAYTYFRNAKQHSKITLTEHLRLAAHILNSFIPFKNLVRKAASRSAND